MIVGGSNTNYHLFNYHLSSLIFFIFLNTNIIVLVYEIMICCVMFTKNYKWFDTF